MEIPLKIFNIEKKKESNLTFISLYVSVFNGKRKMKNKTLLTFKCSYRFFLFFSCLSRYMEHGSKDVTNIKCIDIVL